MNRLDILRSLIGTGPLARENAPFRLVQVTGPDAGDFLQRLCTQDVLGLAEGQVKPAAFLDAKGKLLVTCAVFRRGTTFGIDVMSEQADKLVELLERYHFTEKLAIERGPSLPCHELVYYGGGKENSVLFPAEQRTAVILQRRGLMFVHSYGGPPRFSAERDEGRMSPVEPRPLSPEHAECVRLLAGLVRVGVETEPTTLALEADLDDHISTTKGCYTGQEIVARINTYGHTNRKLCLLLLAPGVPITAPLPLHELEDQLAVGRVMHAVPIPDRQERLGVGYLPKDFQAIGTKLALADGAAVEVIGYEPLAGLPA